MRHVIKRSITAGSQTKVVVVVRGGVFISF
jgi:hypothetical protein